MQNCPRSCPSRRSDPEDVRNMDKSSDSLPAEISRDIATWKQSIHRPLIMESLDVSVYDENGLRFQEYQKAEYEMKYQLQKGITFSKC